MYHINYFIGSKRVKLDNGSPDNLSAVSQKSRKSQKSEAGPGKSSKAEEKALKKQTEKIQKSVRNIKKTLNRTFLFRWLIWKNL